MTNKMARNDKIETELAQIKALLERAQRRAAAQFYLSFGVVGMLGAFEIRSLSPVFALFIYILAVLLLIAAGLKYGYGWDWIPD